LQSWKKPTPQQPPKETEVIENEHTAQQDQDLDIGDPAHLVAAVFAAVLFFILSGLIFYTLHKSGQNVRAEERRRYRLGDTDPVMPVDELVSALIAIATLLLIVNRSGIFERLLG
jgi:hypothetical protein